MLINPKQGNETIFSFFSINDGYLQVMFNFQVQNLNETINHLGVPLEKENEISEF